MKQILLNSFRLNATLLVAVLCALFTGQAWADDYELYSGTITEGDYIIYYNGVALKNTISNYRFGYSSVTPSAGVISDPATNIIWHIAASGDYWTLYNSAVEKYAGSTGSKNQGALLASISNNAKWTVIGTSTYNFENKARAAASQDPNNKWLRYNDGYGFACYSSSTGGALSLYKKVSHAVTGVSLNKSETTLEVGNTETLTATVAPANADNKNVSWESDDTAVATVDASGVVTAVAAGTANITVTTDDGSYSASCAVTVNAASDTKPSADPVIVFYESFDKCSAIGGNDGTWSGITGTSYNPTTDQADWTWGYQAAANKCSRYGTGSALGYAQTPSLALEAGITYTLTFKAGAWNGSSESTNLKLSATKATLDRSSVTMSKGVWTTYTVTITNASAGATVKFEGNSASNSRFFLDEVRITKPGVSITSTSVTTHKHYATYCYQYPLDLDGISGAKAYIVNAIDTDNEKLTLTQITGTIKGGVPFVLKSDEESAEIEIPLADESTTVPAGNLLVGTLAPTFVEQVVDGKTNFAYSKSNGCFVKLGAAGNTVPANRAYLPINLGGGYYVKAFTFVFEDADGIQTIDNGQLTMDNGEFTIHNSQFTIIYNLAGQRLSKMQKGINIINGKKVLVK